MVGKVRMGIGAFVAAVLAVLSFGVFGSTVAAAPGECTPFTLVLLPWGSSDAKEVERDFLLDTVDSLLSLTAIYNCAGDTLLLPFNGENSYQYGDETTNGVMGPNQQQVALQYVRENLMNEPTPSRDLIVAEIMGKLNSLYETGIVYGSNKVSRSAKAESDNLVLILDFDITPAPVPDLALELAGDGNRFSQVDHLLVLSVGQHPDAKSPDPRATYLGKGADAGSPIPRQFVTAREVLPRLVADLFAGVWTNNEGKEVNGHFLEEVNAGRKITQGYMYPKSDTTSRPSLAIITVFGDTRGLKIDTSKSYKESLAKMESEPRELAASPFVLAYLLTPSEQFLEEGIITIYYKEESNYLTRLGILNSPRPVSALDEGGGSDFPDWWIYVAGALAIIIYIVVDISSKRLPIGGVIYWIKRRIEDR